MRTLQSFKLLSAFATALLVATNAHAAGRARALTCDGLFVASAERAVVAVASARKPLVGLQAATSKSSAEPSVSQIVLNGKTKTVAQAKRSMKPVEDRALKALEKKSNQLVDDNVPMQINERVVMEGELQNYVSPGFIPVEHSHGVDVQRRNDDGEFVAVSFMIGANRAAPSNAGALGYSGAGNGQLGYGGRGSAVTNQNQNRNEVAATAKKTTSISEIRAMGLNPTEIFTNYVRDELKGHDRIDQRTIDHMVEVLQGDPGLMAQALALHQSRTLRVEGTARGNGVAVNLSNTGSYRYFRFTPKGHNEEMIARVLDIDRSGEPVRGFHVLVEWMRPASDQDTGPRIRHIQTLSVEELQTMRPMPDSIRKIIETEFQNSLTRFEIQTQRLATIAKLKTFGYTYMSRHDTGNKSHHNPLSDMSGVTHRAARSQVETRFGSLEEFLTPDEKAAPDMWRVYDVMGRLNPRFVLKRFESRDTGFQYMFVITEDGQLKISPFGEKTFSSRPDILRLSHGRRIFGGGTFTIAGDGRLNITLESHGYQDIQARGNSADRANSYRTEGQGGIDGFVAFAFGLQAGRAVTGISTQFADVFYSNRGLGREDNGKDELGNDRFGGHTSFFKSFTDARDADSRNYAGFNSKEAFDFAFEAFDSAALARHRGDRARARSLRWEDSVGPLDFEAWLREVKLVSRDDRANQYDWSHYVLRSNPDMSVEQIQQQFRRAASLFHPDRRQDLDEPVARALFQRAFEAQMNLDSNGWGLYKRGEKRP